MAKLAFVVDRAFDDAAFQTLYDRVREAGHEVLVVGPHAGRQVDGSQGRMHLTLDASLDEVDPGELDGVVLPRGFKRDHLRTHERLLNFIRDVYANGKPVGVLHEDEWLMAGADAKGRGLASWPAIKRDLLIEPGATAGFERDALFGSKTEGVDEFCDAFLAQLEKGPRGGAVHHPEPALPHESPHPVD